ncbi:hypothetical protein QEN19_000793 [Hanseniaspora menglaensis]
MKFLSSIFFTLACLFAICKAQSYEFWAKDDKVSNFYGCKYAVSFQAMYCAKDTTKVYTCQCKDKVAQSAFVYCAIQATKNDTSALENFLELYNDKCSSLNKTFTLENLYKIYDNATKYMETSKEYGKFNKTVDILRTPLIYNSTIFKWGRDSYTRRYRNESRGIIFGITTVAYWFAVFFIGAIYQLVARIFPSVSHSKSMQKLKNSVWIKTYKQPIKIFGISLGHFPNFLESLIIGGSFIILMVGAFWGYSFHKHDIIWKLKSVQISRYVGDRTGYLSLFTMNLTFLFAGRNNFLLWATGWNFSGFIMYHKFIARITVLLVFAHAIAYVVNSVIFSKYASRHVQNYWIWGSVALICGLLMAISGNYVVRKTFYDIFVITHIIMAVFFLIGTWYHLVNVDLEYYCFSTIAVWALDRILRLFRMFVVFGGFKKNKISIFNSSGSKSDNGYVDENDIFLKIDVDNYNKALFKMKDGNFAFVYIMHPRGFWQSHPFTIIKNADSQNFSIVIKVKKGLTKHVYNSIAKSGKNYAYYKVCVEGPYGVSKHSSVAGTDNLSVITVGTGVSGPLCYLDNHRNTKLTEKSGKPNVLHWGVRSLNVVDAYQQELINLAEKGNVQIKIYCNSAPSQSIDSIAKNASESDLEKKEEFSGVISTASSTKNIFNFENVELIQSYMSVEEVIEEDMNDSSSLTIMTCGLPAICDEARYQFLKKLDNKNGSYQFIDDSQVW